MKITGIFRIGRTKAKQKKGMRDSQQLSREKREDSLIKKKIKEQISFTVLLRKR